MQGKRNRLGQFTTPPELAEQIVAYAKQRMLPFPKVRFLEPAFGMGAFFEALLNIFPATWVEQALGYEIDLDIGKCAQERWQETSLELHLEDFTKARPPQSMDERANLLICNPPYVRHHHIPGEEKTRLKLAIDDRLTSSKPNGLSGLYCYFLLLAHNWMAEDALAGWLVPSEFMYVNYGEPIREYLTQKVTLLHVHRFRPDEPQFDDALVSSAVIWFRNMVPPPKHKVTFSFGGSLLNPDESTSISLNTLRRVAKWNQQPRSVEGPPVLKGQPASRKLSDLFVIKRGLATGANRFFILTPEEVAANRLPAKFLKPVLPSSRYLSDNEIQADGDGNPHLAETRLLLDCNLPMERLRTEYPSLYQYLEKGIDEGINERTLCKSRRPWYSQEKRSPAPLLCTYMGRHLSSSSPFRFILNNSNAIVTNTYLMMYPRPYLAQMLVITPGLLKEVWQALNKISIDRLKAEGRVYGGGLYKLEPGELSNIPADSILHILPEGIS